MTVERYPNLKEEVGGSIHGCEISSPPDKNLAGGWLPHVLWRWHVGLLSQKQKQKIIERLLVLGNPITTR